MLSAGGVRGARTGKWITQGHSQCKSAAAVLCCQLKEIPLRGPFFTSVWCHLSKWKDMENPSKFIYQVSEKKKKKGQSFTRFSVYFALSKSDKSNRKIRWLCLALALILDPRHCLYFSTLFVQPCSVGSGADLSNLPTTQIPLTSENTS